MAHDYDQRAEMPVTPEEAARAGRDALVVARQLLAAHVKAPSNTGKMRLRAAAALIWLALLSACQVVILRRSNRDRPDGGPKDVEDAMDLARTKRERDAAWNAHTAMSALYVQGFSREDIDPRRITYWLRTAQAALRAVARGS
ncbi:hypothetical protein [Anaeromyxobacter paludicola]|uniref:hypothetical protein n=1 Tax=Anaeromyxobacter paludicola TaxID=2918171 RepID=UPI0020C0644A|nr:hypothetical protein [Anaeromyxobacter paludicola]